MLAGVGALLGEPARTRILTALLTGCALTAKELAYFAGVTAPTASSHLSRLVAGQLLVMEKQGRCHYYRLRSAEVARAIEGLMTVAPAPVNGWPPNHRIEPALRDARLCYDHLAGVLGVDLTQALVDRGALDHADGGFALTVDGEAAMSDFGVDVPALRRRRRPLTRACKDWTEPGHHLAGGLGAAIASQCFERRWIERGEAGRIVRVTPAGRRELRAWAGVQA